MSVRRLGIFVALCVAGLTACGGDGGVKDEDLAGLVVAPPDEEAPVDPAKAATDATELARALAIKHHDVTKALGAHTVTIATEYEVSEGDKIVEALIDESVLEVSADGQYHAKYDNNRDYGREVIFLDGNLYLRQRYARWHKRAPNDKKEAAQ